MSRIDLKSFGLSVAAAFVFVAVLEWIVHGVLLMGLYEQTSHLWRGADDMKGVFIFLSEISFVCVVGLLYVLGQFTCRIGFSVCVGLTLVALGLGIFAYMPIPFSLWLSWLIVDFVKGFGTAYIFSKLYKL